jgi:hypothetical protein
VLGYRAMTGTKKNIEIVPATRVDEVLAKIPKFTMGYVAAIAFGAEGGPPRNVATVTAVQIAGGRFLVTARHVVDCPAAAELPWRLLVPVRDPAGRVPHRVWAAPQLVGISSGDVAWKSDVNDVAIIRAPSGLPLDFFDGEISARMTTKVRETWDDAAEQGAYRPFVTSGFPSFARTVGDHRADYGLLSLAGSIVHATRPSESRSPIINLNIGCRKMRPEWSSMPEAALFVRQLESAPEPLAGLSGAPIVLVTESAFHLVGIFVEGTRDLDAGRAVPWDAVQGEFLESLSIGTTRQIPR